MNGKPPVCTGWKNQYCQNVHVVRVPPSLPPTKLIRSDFFTALIFFSKGLLSPITFLRGDGPTKVALPIVSSECSVYGVRLVMRPLANGVF